MISLSSAWRWKMQQAQIRYKKYYDEKTNPAVFKPGQWVMVKFPQDETGQFRKLSRPWHGPYRVLTVEDPNLSVS